MLIVPHCQTVVILPPRTGSGTLIKAVLRDCPGSFLLYRHMEADGVPHGYDKWHKVGILRNPVDRLWSLYKFLHTINSPSYNPVWLKEQRDSVLRYPSFSDWIVNNDVVFTYPPPVCEERPVYEAQYSVLHPTPETKKSQYIYLRPDLGTIIVPYENLSTLASRLGADINTAVMNVTSKDEPMPPLSAEAEAHVRWFFSWDEERHRAEVSSGVRQRKTGIGP